ncbi:MAG TPA: transglycosylase SLT domain-containing protein [Steroidobacteraceae bacterium]|nr:transglycosylase SLT domain-containing protein [Steroidobacteraceae bacterium]
MSGGDTPAAQASAQPPQPAPPQPAPLEPPQPVQPAAHSAGPPASGAASAPASSAGTERTRLEFMAAMQRVRLGLPDLEDSRALKHYPIYSYLIAARLHRDLERAPQEQLDSAIDDFLKTHAGQPVVRSLRRAWLAGLAERGRWDWFLPRSADVTDPTLLCDRLAGRLATGAVAGLADEALARWSLPQRAPRECDPVFEWLRKEGLITPERQEARARAALHAGTPALARELTVGLSEERARPLLQWAQLLDAPKSSLDLLAMTPQVGVEPDALIAGFTRLSYSDAQDAGVLLPLLTARPDLSPATRDQLARAAALGAAFSHQPDAVARFAGIEAAADDTLLQEWRVRAALWAGDEARALSWIEAMPAPLAAQPRWRYWRARAMAEVSGAQAAAPLLDALAGSRDYFGYLAADRLHRGYELNIHPTVDEPRVQAALAVEPALVRAHALFDCDLADDAQVEWSAALGAAPPALKIQAARLAARWGWYSQAIATLAQANEWDDVVLRYPRPYSSLITRASSLTQVPADWIFAVMRQESLFRKDAVSHADARGLMQMQPATANAVARRWHLPRPSRDDLFAPDIAVPLGAAYVRELLDRYDGQLELALAAYNAGPVSVARWLPGRRIDADVWIENIPYAETRAYVQHVLEHIVAFAAVRDAQPPRLSALLQPVAPAGASAAAPASRLHAVGKTATPVASRAQVNRF